MSRYLVYILLFVLLGCKSPQREDNSYIVNTDTSGISDSHQILLEDFDILIQENEDPGRVTWQNPEMVISKMGDINDLVVADIGTGTGYLAAILAELVDKVYTIEINTRLTEKAKNRLLRLGYNNIEIKTGDGYLGWEEFGPFDGIIVTCSPDHIPPPLIKQLAVGGKMVIPVSYASKVQELILIEKEKNGDLKKTNLIPVQFVPLRRGKNGE